MEFAGGKMLASVADGVGTITFNNPEKHNAVSPEMMAGLAEILDRFEGDRAVRVIVVTGAGERAFVSGGDLSQPRPGNAAVVDRERLAASRKPVIARIRGYCIGGGLNIALQADLRIAARDAQFGYPPAKLGRPATFESVQRLAALVGPAHARMLLFTGGRIQAAEAERIGLVNRVVEVDALDTAVAALARDIAESAPLSLAALKIAFTEAEKDAGDRDMASVNAAIAACNNSADINEGRIAFLEKRKPVFRGE